MVKGKGCANIRYSEGGERPEMYGMGGVGGLVCDGGGGGLVCQPASRIATVASRRPKTKTHLHAEQLRNHRRGTCVCMRDITAMLPNQTCIEKFPGDLIIFHLDGFFSA